MASREPNLIGYSVCVGSSSAWCSVWLGCFQLMWGGGACLPQGWGGQILAHLEPLGLGSIAGVG